jgi:hypothetical protein
MVRQKKRELIDGWMFSHKEMCTQKKNEEELLWMMK